MTMPLIVGLVVGALALIALAMYANRPQPQTARQAAARHEMVSDKRRA